ncbi:MAG: bifunctional hydroxymethylpyrimidine kinase/phosphomethylpyrimidine kinase [Pseudomonadota bacterium]
MACANGDPRQGWLAIASDLAHITLMTGRVLIIAGSDPSGGAGIQADIKAVTTLGGYAMTAITALTVQNTTGVQGVMALPPDFIRHQIDAVLSDVGADVIKIGMLGNREIAEAVADAIDLLTDEIQVIVDPVLVATSGNTLSDDGVKPVLLDRLMPRAALSTPNVDEATALTGEAISCTDDLRRAGEILFAMTKAPVLLKGGHLSGDSVEDILLTSDGATSFSHARIETTSTHGTGCTLASAIAAGLGQGATLGQAIKRARAFLLEAIRTAPGFGAGHGPVNHGHTVQSRWQRFEDF